MKREFKGFVVGVIVTVILMSTAVFAGGVKQKIEVIFNSVNLAVNGKPVKADNILYKGTTYVPLRAVAEMLGKEVGWDQKTKTASINDPGTSQEPSQEYSRTNPAPIGVTQRLVRDTYGSNYSLDITIKEVLRGEEAVKSPVLADRYTYYFEEDEEPILAKAHVKVVYSKDDKKVPVNRSYFKLFSGSDVEYLHAYSDSHLIEEQAFGETSLYQGAEHQGYLLLKVKKSDANPKLVYGSKSDGTGGIWFKLK